MGDMGAGFHLPPARFLGRKPVPFLDFRVAFCVRLNFVHAQTIIGGERR